MDFNTTTYHLEVVSSRAAMINSYPWIECSIMVNYLFKWQPVEKLAAMHCAPLAVCMTSASHWLSLKQILVIYSLQRDRYKVCWKLALIVNQPDDIGNV